MLQPLSQWRETNFFEQSEMTQGVMVKNLSRYRCSEPVSQIHVKREVRLNMSFESNWSCATVYCNKLLVTAGLRQGVLSIRVSKAFGGKQLRSLDLKSWLIWPFNWTNLITNRSLRLYIVQSMSEQFSRTRSLRQDQSESDFNWNTPLPPPISRMVYWISMWFAHRDGVLLLYGNRLITARS